MKEHNPRSTPPFDTTIWVWDVTHGRSVSTEGIPYFAHDRPLEAKVAPVWGDMTMDYYRIGTLKIAPNRLLWWHTKEECARYMVNELLRRGRVLEKVAESMFECAFEIQEEFKVYEKP